MPDPESQSVPAWQVLWNDPITNREYQEVICMMREQNVHPHQLPAGFVPNAKRGTAYYWADDATQAFLVANGFSHVIRGHEVQMNGYALHSGGRVITIFSTSRYCGMLNEAAVALVAHNKIRIIKVDT